ncbi:putative micrococcal nuclease [Dioscorea sansibarensis]
MSLWSLEGRLAWLMEQIQYPLMTLEFWILVVFLQSPLMTGHSDPSLPPSAGQPEGTNVAELMVVCGFATVARHRDFEERSIYYDALLAAEGRAASGKKGLHSKKDIPAMHIRDLTMASTKQTIEFLPILARSCRLPAVVEHVFIGHRFKLVIPKETCSVVFSFSGVRCPGWGDPFSDEAIFFM